MEKNIEASASLDLAPPLPAPSQKCEDIPQILEHLHRELIEWMTEGTHPHRAPRADHG